MLYPLESRGVKAASVSQVLMVRPFAFVPKLLELIVTPVQKNSIEFTSYIIREESRDTVELLETRIPRSDDIINMCSMCKKIELSGKHWVEVEVAIASLKLFQHHKLPQISHGLCAECFELGMAEIKKLGFSSPDQKPSADD